MFEAVHDAKRSYDDRAPSSRNTTNRSAYAPVPPEDEDDEEEDDDDEDPKGARKYEVIGMDYVLNIRYLVLYSHINIMSYPFQGF